MAPEFASATTPTVPVRDSKTPDGPVLLLGRAAWDVFVASV
ncbi:DUF397 domain-containing protein [Streptomyces sp. 900105755]